MVIASPLLYTILIYERCHRNALLLDSEESVLSIGFMGIAKGDVP